MHEKIRVYAAAPELAPVRAHPTDAGLDLRAASDWSISIGSTAQIDSGVHAEIPEGHFGLLALRSSMSRRDLVMPNGIGVIDSDYRGSIKVPLKNVGVRIERIQAGDRIAQLLLIPCVTPEVELVDALTDLTPTQRGEGGFGSTGKK